MNSSMQRLAMRIARAPVAAVSRRTLVSPTLSLWEQHRMKVPTMGDSITEGTIVEWTAQVGQAVKDGDVVALVETDKVTVEIKAEIDGVVTQQFGAVDDTVEVGSDLYELDTEAEATVEAGQVSAPAPEVAAAPAPVAAKPAEPVPTAAAPSLRVPSIHFLGKAGWEKRLKGGDSSSVVVDLPRMYGRPEFSEEEMEALITGGATLTPEVVSPSRGAKFKYL